MITQARSPAGQHARAGQLLQRLVLGRFLQNAVGGTTVDPALLRLSYRYGQKAWPARRRSISTRLAAAVKRSSQDHLSHTEGYRTGFRTDPRVVDHPPALVVLPRGDGYGGRSLPPAAAAPRRPAEPAARHPMSVAET